MQIVNRARAEEREVVPRPCTLLEECVVEEGERDDWRKLGRYHYRSDKIPCVKQIYRARHVPTGRTVAVRVYAAPSLNSRNRNIVLNNEYLPGSNRLKGLMAQMVNEEVEVALRTVVHPTFRGCGLGAKLVRETLPKRPVRFVEASTAMGAFNPFLKRAGMEAFELPPNPATVRMLAALRAFGVRDEQITNPKALEAWIAALPDDHRAVVEKEVLTYERFWIKGRTDRDAPITLEHGVRRVAANALLTPVYYLWQNPAWAPPSDPPATSAPSGTSPASPS
jgi:GNAT superfamily N-acetyltransferase